MVEKHRIDGSFSDTKLMQCVLHFKIPNSCSHLCNKLRKLIIEVEVYKKLSRFSILLEDL
jgi:hypothetical protein